MSAVEAFGQDHAVQTTCVSPEAKRARDGVALVLQRRAIDMLGADAGLSELARDVHGVRDVDREHHRAAALGVFVPMGDDVADEVVTVYARSELAFDIVALLDADAAAGRGSAGA